MDELNRMKIARVCRPISLVLVASLVAMVVLHQTLDRAVQEKIDTSGSVTLPNPSAVQLCAGGFDRVAADMFWLAFIQYCGDVRPKGTAYQGAYPYVDLITQLDPYFQKAYWFGCWAIGYWQQRPDLAAKIMQRGIVYNPHEWYMPFMAGINQYLFAKNYKAAAKYYRQAAKLPGAPDYLERQAQVLESDIPELAKKIATLNELYRSAPEGNLKASVHAELVALLYQMYLHAPTEQIRKQAKERLVNLGIDSSELELSQ